MTTGQDVLEILGGLALFADLSRPQLEAAAHSFEEAYFDEGERIIRQGFGGTNFYVILDGEASVVIDGEQRPVRLRRGDFFGEISVLLGVPPSADVVARSAVHCAILGGPDFESFMKTYPKVMYRMLQAEAKRLLDTTRWRS